MVALQIISRILSTQSVSILKDNLITPEYFIGYEDEISFILDHVDKYNTVPDKLTFISKFNDIELVEVNESDKYLVDTIREEYLYYRAVPVVQRVAELLKTDANDAAEYMIQAVKTLQPQFNLGGQDIIKEADKRYEEFVDKKSNQGEWYFTTGFPELDELVHGIQRRDELFVIFARTNQGKSWVLEKMCQHIWQIGFNVGYISTEMTATGIGYRFDTLYRNYSNKDLMWGGEKLSNDEYKSYTNELKNSKSKFIVASSKDFNQKITVSKLKNWIVQYNLQVIAIDGITYLTDERYQRGDSKTISLTNISQDLMSLSMEMEVPVILVSQANRQGVSVDEDDDSTPDLENIRDSDGIAFNASKVVALRQLKNGVLVIEVKKQRYGSVGGKVYYSWDIDKGEFKSISNKNNSYQFTSSKEIDSTVSKRKTDQEPEDVF